MNIAVLLGGGKSERFGVNKLLEILHGKPVYKHSLETFLAHPDIHQILLVGTHSTLSSFQEDASVSSKISLIEGGGSRFESTKKAYVSLHLEKKDFLVFHNLANPFVTPDEITQSLIAAKENGAAGAGRKVTSTLRHKEQGIIPRDEIYEMETPQALSSDIFEKGLQSLKEKNIRDDSVTDDLFVAECAGMVPKILPANPKNRKITYKKDLFFFENNKIWKSGIGQDSHQFSDKGELILGGIIIPDAPKLLANSDGDAALHALCNALSSALGEGSFSLFADDMCKKGITDSKEYVSVLLEKMQQKDGDIEHISFSFEGKKPKLESHFLDMKKSIADICGISPKNIGCTATTGEGLSECGKGKGIAVTVIATLSFSA